MKAVKERPGERERENSWEKEIARDAARREEREGESEIEGGRGRERVTG